MSEASPASETFAIVAGGGTAGHLLPGLAVARALVARGHDPASIHFVGGNRGVEARLVPAAGFSLDELPGRGIQRKPTLANIAAIWGLVRALAAGYGIVRRRRPTVVIALGGHASIACALGARLCRVPVVVLEQNVRAGAVNRIVGRFARAAAVSVPGTDLPRAVVTGNPLRPEIMAAAAQPDRAGARRALGLPDDRTVIAVFSGSLGSRRINDAVRGLVERWADRADLAIRHVIGHRDHAEYVASAPTSPPDGLVYQVVAYEDHVEHLLGAADLAVTRAGGTVFELAAMGVPAILVPLPIATRDHQTGNAEWLVGTGAAVCVPDGELTTDRLERELTDLLADGGARLAAMGEAMLAAASPDAADRVAELVESTAAGGRTA